MPGRFNRTRYPFNVTSMITDRPTQLSLAQLFDALPDSVLYYRAVRDELNRHIIDFIVDYINPAVHENGQHKHLVAIGTSVRHDNQPGNDTTERVFSELIAVAETGHAHESEYYNQTINNWLSTTRTKAGDGVLSISRIITANLQAASDSRQRAELYDGVLDASINGIITYAAVRNQTGSSAGAGTILDFRSIIINPMAQQMLNLPNTVPGWLLLDRFPTVRDYGLFDQYIHTVETGEPMRFETPYEADGVTGWYDVAVVKLGDGFVITFNDITVAKQGQQTIEQIRTNLQAVIDTSQTGIVVLGAVLDDAGAVVDFRFKTANQTVAALVGQTHAIITGALASDWFASYRDTPAFGHYKHTFETGEDQRFDIHYTVHSLDIWVDVQSVKFGNDVLLTFTDYSELKQIQQAVERQANLLGRVLDSSNNGIIAFESIRNEQGTIVDFSFTTINEACERILNMPLETMWGNTLMSLFPGTIGSGLFALFVNTTETGEPGRTEVYYNLDGLDFWLDISAGKLGDGFVVTFTDISAQKRVQQTVERQTELLRSVLDSSVNGIVALTAIRDQNQRIIDFIYVSVNESACRLTGKTADELIGALANSVFEGNVQSGLFDQYIRTVETGEPTHAEIDYVYDGLNFWTDISAEKLGDGIVITFTDISAQKQAAQRIEQSAAELQTVIDTAQTGIFLFSPVRTGRHAGMGDAADRPEAGEVVDFRFRLVNRMLAAYVGQEPETIIGTLGSRWFPDYKTNGLFDAYLKTYLTGETQRFDIHYDSSGIDAWLDIMSTKIGDEVLVTFGDYTPLKKLQQKLETLVVDLQRSNANLEQFAYVASHDLQEPLRKIQAFGDIIQTKYAPVIGSEGADMIERMQAAAARMQVLIRDVLAYSRVATKRDAIGPVDLNVLVAGVVGDLETAIVDHEATITVDPLPTLTGDAGQLRQLFQNLLSNALKFMKPRVAPGETSASAEQNALVRVTVRTIRGSDADMAIPPGDSSRLFHLIEITDNGIGFEPNHAERIFQVFQRLHNRSAYLGTGIGLAIVKKVVENHNGHIQAVGRPGDGATFRILLPT